MREKEVKENGRKSGTDMESLNCGKDRNQRQGLKGGRREERDGDSKTMREGKKKIKDGEEGVKENGRERKREAVNKRGKDKSLTKRDRQRGRKSKGIEEEI